MRPVRAVVDLLDVDLIFSQRVPLSPRQFAKECERRGLALRDMALGEHYLDMLHRSGVLVPLFRVRREMRSAFAAARRDDQQALYTSTLGQHVSARGPQLRWYRDHGRLRDPRMEAYRPWSVHRRSFEGFDGFQTSASEFLYSRYQLLLAPTLRRALPRIRYRRKSGGGHCSTLRRTGSEPATWQSLARENDELVFVLSALETKYLPRVTGGLANHGWGDLEAVLAYDRAFDPVQMLAWLKCTPESLVEMAQRLLSTARSVDPLGRWHRLVGMGRSDMWQELRGDALIANDHRVAGEMLLLFYEDLAHAGVAPQLETPPPRLWHPWRERLASDRDDVDAVLTEFGLSPHPSLVLVLEGDTEMILVPRVMELLDVPRSRTFIELVNSQGVNRDLGPLAPYVAAPRLGEPVGEDGISLTRPATKFMVTFDADKGFRTEEDREKKRKEWVDRIHGAVGRAQGKEVSLDDLDGLVVLETWDRSGQAFEFAHFTDQEILDAILRTYTEPEEPNLPACHHFLGTLAEIRENRGNIKKFLRRWNGEKTEVAEELWPVLKKKIDHANRREPLDDIPVARVVLRAAELANETLRHSVMIRWAARVPAEEPPAPDEADTLDEPTS